MDKQIRTFVTSDNHFNHPLIVKVAHRPFKSMSTMENKMINNWNHLVKEQDIVYILGDFILSYNGKERIKEILKKLNGRKILVRGNHDRTTRHWYLANGIDFVCNRFTDYINDKSIMFIHDPDQVSKEEAKHYDIILHGHKHVRPEDDKGPKFGKYYNVNVELHKYKPILLSKIFKDNNKKVNDRKEKLDLKKEVDGFNYDNKTREKNFKYRPKRLQELYKKED